MRLLLLLLLLLGIATGSSQARIFTEVKPNHDECFDEVAVEGSTGLRGSFEVIEGGRLDIGLVVTLDSSGKVVHQLNQVRRGDLDVKAGPGRYTVCFTTPTTSGKRVVGFSLHGEAGDLLLEDEDVVKTSEHVQPIHATLDQLAFKIQKLQEHERYLGERMHRHIKTAESTSSRVFWASLVEFGVLLAVNLAQVWYMKRYFETRRKL